MRFIITGRKMNNWQIQREKSENGRENQKTACFWGYTWYVEDVSWWKEELWSHKEQRNLFFTLDIMKSENKRIDYVLSHTCPRDLLIPMFGISPMDDPDPTTSMLQAVYDDLGSGGFTGWYFGHWHQDKSMGKFH